jgi:glutaredoxin
MTEIILYTSAHCPDCRRAKLFLNERGVPFREINIDDDPEAEALVLRENDGRRKVPTIWADGRFFACSPFNPHLLSEQLHIPLNP